MTLAIKGVTKRFGDITALTDITLSLTGPKLVVILGPNGAGKTTFLDLVEGLTEPSAGTISLFDRAVGPDDYPRRKIGVVMQREFILDGVTVRDYADLFAAIYEVEDGQSKILERAELKARAHVSVERLSGGEAQRLFIAAATVHDPAILFLDEPTSELDPESKRRLGEVLREQAKRALVVMTTHDLEEADRLADEVVFLFDGKLRAHGSKSEVIGTSANLHEAFFHYCGRTLARWPIPMTRALRVLVRIRLAEITRKPSGAFWFFALPLILLGLLAGLFANGHPFERHHVAVVGTLSRPEALGQVVLDPVSDEEHARARLESRAASAAIIGDRVLVGEREELFGRGIAGVLGSRVALEVVPLASSGYTQFLVPGVLAQGVVIAGLFGMGYAMVRYRQSRFLRKLATTPLSRSEFVLSQLIARVILVSLQLLLMLVVARVAFGIPLGASAIGWVLLVGAMGLITFMGIGFCISCVVETEGNVVDIINALSVPVALLSEIFFSSSELPRVVGWISGALPSTAMVRSFRAVLLHTEDPMSVILPSLGVLAVWAAVTYGIAVRTFKWR